MYFILETLVELPSFVSEDLTNLDPAFLGRIWNRKLVNNPRTTETKNLYMIPFHYTTEKPSLAGLVLLGLLNHNFLFLYADI